jgi:hypothetical protein
VPQAARSPLEITVNLLTTSVPAPETIRTTVLTPKGDATRLLYRLVAALGVLPDDDRRAVLTLFAEETAELPPVN